ncbi:hypothetical protein KCMC57_up02450 [Kitasatospora sp. CMC57]|uniref:DUF2178 domain-containing protein n=1 Tax=Kitasatospora sp. CMC57 TaxID=3231513 RepID=A0AB33JRD6_9ACTN
MAIEEKRAWTMLLVSIGAYGAYLVAVLDRPEGAGLTQAPYVTALLWSVGGAILTSIVLHVAMTTFSPKEENVRDQRDREIHRFGQYVGQSFTVIGGVAGLVLAMAGQDRFWIANAIYLAFVLSAVLSAAARIGAYRFGLHPW